MAAALEVKTSLHSGRGLQRQRLLVTAKGQHTITRLRSVYKLKAKPVSFKIKNAKITIKKQGEAEASRPRRKIQALDPPGAVLLWDRDKVLALCCLLLDEHEQKQPYNMQRGCW